MNTENQLSAKIDKVILVDIDGTLIGEDYQPTNQSIHLLAEQIRQSGWKIGLSSDTPLEAMQVWGERFSMTDPIIAEKGAIVKLGDRVMVDEGDIQAFQLSKLRIEEEIGSKGLLLWRGNPVEAIRGSLRLGKPGEVIVLMNTLRVCSLSFFVREIDEQGNLKINKSVTDQIVGEMRNFYPDLTDLEEDLNYDYGIVIVMRGKVNKRNGTKILMEELGLARVSMIGNSMSDFIGEDIATHYAVANASDSFKEKCAYVSSSPLTDGVNEILSNILYVTC